MRSPLLHLITLLALATPAGADTLTDLERAIIRHVDGHAAEGVALLERIVNINSGTMNFAGVREVGAVLRKELDALGFATRWEDGAPYQRAGHLIAERNGAGPRLLLIGHLDTVFEPQNPFQRFETVDATHARGPGVIDMKGGDVVALQALAALKAAGALDRMSVTVVFHGDEEDAGEPVSLARRTLIEAAKGAAAAIAFECGDGDPATAVAARRGSSSWLLQVAGTPAHSSQIFREDIGPGAIFETARILQGFREKLTGDPLLTFNPGVALGGTAVSLDPARIKGEAAGKSNVVAERMVVAGDLRTISPEKLEWARTEMRAVTAAHLPHTRAEIAFDESYPPMAPTEGNRRLLALYDQVSRDLGFGPVGMDTPARVGAADVSFVAGIVPMAIDGIGLAGRDDHTPKETADLATLPMQVKRAAVLMWRLAQPAVPAGAASTGLAERLRTQFEPILDQAIKDHGIPGFVMAVVADGQTVYTLTRGVRSLSGEEALHERSLFHMASVTKTFVATAVMQLAEAGRVDLDQPVQRYLPYFRLQDPRGAAITVRQMLSHTSGMPDVTDYEWEKAVADDGALERYVRSLSDREPIAAPGERFQYSNMAYEVLGDLIAKVSGETFEGYVKAHILAPLGMKDSTLLRSEANPRLTTSPHVLGDRLTPIVSPVYPYNRMHAPSSTLHSNLADMSRWALANLRRGELDGKRILKASSYDVMWKPTGDPKRPVAISWFQGDRGGHRTVSHGGGDVGYRSNVLLLPDDGIAVVLMSNFDALPGEIRDAATDVVLGLTPARIKQSLARTLGRTILDQGAGAAVQQYRALKASAPDDYDFREPSLNSLGYWLLGHDRTADAVEIFKLNVEAYPGSSNPYDSLGEAYRKLGQRDLALASYRKALELDPASASAKAAVKELEQER